MERDIFIAGIPEGVSDAQTALFRSRILKVVSSFIQSNIISEISLGISTTKEDLLYFEADKDCEHKTNQRSDQPAQLNPQQNNPIKYSVQNPLYTFEKLVLSPETEQNLLLTVDALTVEEVIFNVWGLREIKPNPGTVINFFGPPGTGKTLAAHAIASRMKRSILLASYADIESKFHGEGPKNLQSLFKTAEIENALLFIDEADSLLSRRLTDVNSGSEQAINSMRSQLLICLEQFSGVVVFATNLAENYDPAFETRVRNIRFELPGKQQRERIWNAHLPVALPTVDINIAKLAEVDDVCGRDIREAVIDAAVSAALRARYEGREPSDGCVSTNDLLDAIYRKKRERIQKTGSNSDDLDINSKIEQQLKLPE
jgi:SpoVK/Ycf46/Vps4 family AAA+-type ATPase